LWSGDITCIATDEGWLYLAAVIGPSQDSQRAWAPIFHPQASRAGRDELDRF
jgi:hypothetical protein